MENTNKNYAHLLTSYCLDLKKGEKLYVRSTALAEPLLKEIYIHALKAGAHAYFGIGLEGFDRIGLEYASDEQLRQASPFSEIAFNSFDAYLVVRAPYSLNSMENISNEKKSIAAQANADIRKIYNQRTANGELKRCLCQYPTEALAKEAAMSMADYEHFNFDACNLFDEDPIASWLKVREEQQKIVDHLNGKERVHYLGKNIDITFSTHNRKWINSDGRNNMPSGEVYTSPVENSVNGKVHFTIPGHHSGKDVEDVTLEVKDGVVVKWDALKGKEVLDYVFSVPGARQFGEVAIGTNTKINKYTRNILFDEKIGGTIHMAVGQSYFQTGGKNESSIHWDLITDMTEDGEIFADGELIYEKGKFLI